MRIITSNLEEEFRRAREESSSFYFVDRRGYYRPVRGIPRVGERLLESEELTPAERRAIRRTAQGITTSPSGGDVLYAEPDIIGPLFDPINWYLPYTYKVLNRWIRYYCRFHPIVGNCIDMHAEIPLSRFSLTGIDDEKILQEYEEIFEELRLYQNLLDMAREYWAIGEVFPFLHWNDEKLCFDHITILNPDYVNVVYTPLAYGSTPQFELEPDDNLVRIVKGNDPLSLSLRENLDPIVIEAIESGTNIPLDPFNVSQIARKQHPYDLRGTSIVLRVLKVLLYEDYLRRAQFAVAQRLITPLRIFQLGDPQGDWIPSPEDVDAFAELLAQGANDPNFAIIGNYALKVEYVGATGKVLPIVPEFEWTTDRILTGLFTNKAMTTGQGPCVSIDTETLTENGWKHYDEISDDEKIATYNPSTGEIEFHKPVDRVCYEFTGTLVELDTDFMTQLATPNHRTYVKRGGEYTIVRADEVDLSDKITCKATWRGTPLPPKISTPKLSHANGGDALLRGYEIDTNVFLEALGYFAATGLTTRHRPQFRDTAIRYVFSAPFEPLERLALKLPFQLSRYNYKNRQIWYVTVVESVAALFSHFVGRTPTTRRLCRELKDATPEQLRIFLDAFMRAQFIDPALPRGAVVAKSRIFADDLQEIFLKLGYAAKVVRRPDRSGWYSVEFSQRSEDLEASPTVRHRSYRGLVYCFEVPNHLYIVRRNGKPVITGNTYANASVAFEVLQMRYLALRGLFELWIREKIAKPIAKARGYIKRSKAEIDHRIRIKREPTYYLPEINWLEKMNLLDDTQQKTFLLRLRERGDIPLKKLCDVFGFDYDEIIKDLKSEIGTVADPQYRMRLQQILAQEQMQSKPTTPPTGGPTPTSPLLPPRLEPLGASKKKEVAKKESEKPKRKPFVRKVFGPATYEKRGEVYFTNEEAIEDAIQKDRGNDDQVPEGREGTDKEAKKAS